MNKPPIDSLDDIDKYILEEVIVLKDEKGSVSQPEQSSSAALTPGSQKSTDATFKGDTMIQTLHPISKCCAFNLKILFSSL